MKNPEKVLSNELKTVLQNNILNLMVSVEQRLIPIIKEYIVIICKQGGGYINAWPELMSVNYSS
jgi:hypothetical protein